MSRQRRDIINQTENRRTSNWLLVLGFLLIAANLRASLNSVGPLISFIREDLAISASVAGFITTIPLIAFAVFSHFVSKISDRIGIEWTVFFALISLIFGILLRSSFGVGALFVGTAFIGLGIAIGNVLLPGIIKMSFPLRIGIMTALYSVAMNIFGALASGLSVPFAQVGNFGWQGSLVLWVILAIIALFIWIPQLGKLKIKPKVDNTIERETPSNNKMWRSKLAWHITIFMGTQSFIVYIILTWLPEILNTHGYSANAAGWMLFLFQLAFTSSTFFIPLFAERLENQKGLSLITGLLFIGSVLLLITGINSIMLIATILLGIANGSAFSLAMMFFSLRTSNGKEAIEISSMAQSFGYVLAAIGPVLFGAVYDLTSSWTTPLFILLAATFIVLYTGVQAGKDRLIGNSHHLIKDDDVP